jgi:hypothetical protein
MESHAWYEVDSVCSMFMASVSVIEKASSLLFAAKFVHTRRALSSTTINSHQETVSGRAYNPPDLH